MVRTYHIMQPGLSLLMLALGMSAAATQASAQIQFSDVTAGTGIDYTGESYGASYGDLNGDGWPDLYVSNHRSRPALWVNRGDGTFANRSLEVDSWVATPFLDQHGGSWADFDNDGDEDLYVALGATDDLQFLVNDGDVLSDQTIAFGLDAYTEWPGRLPVWLDFDADGALDFVMMTRGFPKIFRQDSGTWIDAKNQVGLSCQDTQYGQLSDLNVDGTLDLICDNQTSWPSRVYDTTTIPFTDITALVPPTLAVNDTAVADFDNDLRPDIFQVRGALRLSEAVQADADSIEAQLIVDNGAEETMTFATAGIVSFLMDWSRRNREDIFIGASGYNPDSFGPQDPIAFDLDPANPDNWGIRPHDPAVEDGVWIGYDTVTGYWTVQVSAGLVINITYWFIDSDQPISDLTTSGLSGGEAPIPGRLLMNRAGGFADETVPLGISAPVRCVSTVAGDFDNDMDQDIYVTCRGGVTNVNNILYENQGDGTFIALANAAGGAGPAGVGAGMGDSVALGDYDVDGFLDLYVTNGLNIYPEKPLFESRGGTDTLYRNLGNTNSWVELDLVGVTSNSSAIGAKVFATANGVTQLREQNGGYHRWSQNHQRIHFGLADNALVDITIEWPSGLVDTYTDVPANTLYRVTESVGYEPVVLGPVEPSACAAPLVDSGTEAGFFIYRNCGTDTWQVLMTAGGTYANFAGRIVSDKALRDLAPLDIEPHDVLESPESRVIDFNLQTWTTGRDEFSFRVIPGAQVCLSIDTPAGTETVFVGSARETLEVPLGLNTLESCDLLEPPPVELQCGFPEFDLATENEVFIWRDCDAPGTDQQWHVRVTSGGVGAGIYGGTVSSEETLAATPAFLEGSDVLDSQPGDGVIDFALKLGSGGVDGFDFALPASGSACFDVTSVGGSAEVLLGATRQPMSGAFDLATLEPCEPVVPPSDPACGFPGINANVDNELFLWRDCAAQGSDQQWLVRVTSGGVGAGTYSGIVTAPTTLAATPAFLENSDKLDTLPGDGAIDFALKLGTSGVDGFQFAVPDGVEACFDAPALAGDAQILLGADRQPVTGPINLTTLESCEPVIPPTDPTCGSPRLTPATDNELFLWRDCAAGSTQQQWYLRVSSGGTGAGTYAGTLTSSQVLNATPAFLEGSDTLDTLPGDGELDFALKLGASGVDGFDFVLDEQSSACFDVSSLPGLAEVVLGANREPISGAFDLNTLAACGP